MLRLPILRRALGTLVESPLRVLAPSDERPMVVIPELDLRQRLRGDEDLRLNLSRRGLKLDVDRMELSLDHLRYVRSETKRLDSRRKMARSKREGRRLKAELKILNDDIIELQHVHDQELLKLPNILHRSVPDEDDVIFHSENGAELVPDGFRPKSHTELVGKDIEFCVLTEDDSESFYLFNRLASLELSLGLKSSHFLRKLGCEILSCPDCVKSVIIDGCGNDFRDPGAEFALKPWKGFGQRSSGQGMHLVGGASLYSMAAYFAKNVVYAPRKLPVTYFCLGRRFFPAPEATNLASLFHTRQSTAVQMFSLHRKRYINDWYYATVNSMVTFYSELGVPFRVVNKGPRNLDNAESKKLCFEMFSYGSNAYIPVGYMSMYGDFISNRLMHKVESSYKGMNNLFSYGGCFLDMTKAIGCIVEHEQMPK